MKHLTLAHDDPAISSLLEEYGPEGYGIYWLVLEHVAMGIEKDSDAIPTRTHSVIEWAKICGCSARRFRQFSTTATELRLISAHSVAELRQFSSRSLADRLQIDVPKLLKYRDEYTKRSVQTPEQMERESRGRADSEEESSSSGGREACVGEGETPPPPPNPPVEPAEQSRGNDGDPMATPSAGTPPPPPATLPGWQRDKSYAPLMAAWRVAKPDAIDADFARNHKHWTPLDNDERRLAVARLLERVRLGLETSSRLKYWLTEDFKRVVDVAPAAGDNAHARNQQRRDNVNTLTKSLLKKRL